MKLYIPIYNYFNKNAKSPTIKPFRTRIETT